MWWVVVVIGLAFVSAIFTTPGAAAPPLDQPTSTSPVIIGLPAQEPAPEDPVIQVVIAFRDFFAPEATNNLLQPSTLRLPVGPPAPELTITAPSPLTSGPNTCTFQFWAVQQRTSRDPTVTATVGSDTTMVAWYICAGPGGVGGPFMSVAALDLQHNRRLDRLTMAVQVNGASPVERDTTFSVCLLGDPFASPCAQTGSPVAGTITAPRTDPDAPGLTFADWLVDGTPQNFAGENRLLPVQGGVAIALYAVPSGLVVIPQSGPDFTLTPSFTPIPDMSGTIAVPGTSDVAITFCAETDITSAGARIFVQALLDDTPTNPSSVVFAQLTQEGNPGTRCFTFISNSVPAGVHTVLIQALAETTATVKARTLHITFAQPNAQELTLLAVWNAPDQLITGVPTCPVWVDILGMSGTLQVPATSDLAITFSVFFDAFTGTRFFLRALVDGEPATPDDVILVVSRPAIGEDQQDTRAFTFVERNVGAGPHNIRVQACVDNPTGNALIHSGTLKVVGVRQLNTINAGRLMVAAPSGLPQPTTSAAFVPVPNLSGSFDVPVASDVPAASDVAIGFSAEIGGTTSDARVFLRAVIDNQPADPEEVLLVTGVGPTEAGDTHTYTFVQQNVAPGPPTVEVQWRVESPTGGAAVVGDRTLTTYLFSRPQ